VPDEFLRFRVWVFPDGDPGRTRTIVQQNVGGPLLKKGSKKAAFAIEAKKAKRSYPAVPSWESKTH
jgi:hypothetical protein